MSGRFMILFLVSILLQIFVFNELGNFITYLPYFGLLPVILYPLTDQKILYLFLAFITGTIIDLSLSTGGIFASSAVIFAFFRNYFVRWFQSGSSGNKTSLKRLSFTSLLLYLTLASFIITLSVYFFHTLSLKEIFQSPLSLLKHALINLFFYSTFSFLFFWDNTYKGVSGE